MNLLPQKESFKQFSTCSNIDDLKCLVVVQGAWRPTLGKKAVETRSSWVQSWIGLGCADS